MSGTTVDTSIPLSAGKGIQQQPNALQQIGQFAQTANALNSLKLFPGQLQQQQQATQNNQLSLQQHINNAGYAALAPLLAGGPITHDSFTTALGSIENNLGLPTSGILQDVFSTAPAGDGPAFDAKIRAQIASRMQTSPESALGVVTPRQGMVDTGPAIQPVNIAGPGMPNQGQVTPIGGVFVKGLGPQFVQTGAANTPTNNGQPTGAAIPNAPSPSEMNQLQQVWNPTTKQFDYVPRRSMAPMVNGAGQPVGGGVAPVPGLPTTGRIQPPSASPAASASAPMGVQQEAEASALHAGAARERANNYQATIYPIEGAITSLAGADTGKGGEALNTIRAYMGDTPLQYFSNFLPATASDQQKRALYDEAQKYTTGMAIGGPGGSRSDAGNQASSAANPNVHISNQAALAVAKSILAQRRMEQAGTLAFNNTPGAGGQPLPANQYDRFMNSWNTSQDPRAYAVDKMTPAERAQLVTSMGGTKSAAYQKFKNSYQQGVSTGVIAGPGGG